MKDYNETPAEETIEKCSECEQDIDTDRDYCEFNASGEIICAGCAESHWDSSVTLYEYEPSDESVRQLDYAYTLDKTRSADDYETFEGAPCCIKSANWEGQGYRGYIAVNFEDGYESIANGWSTDSYDDVKWKWSFNEFLDNVLEGTMTPPVEVWFVFARTSNIFSMATDVVVRSNEVDTFLEWLAKEAGMTREQLKTALS